MFCTLLEKANDYIHHPHQFYIELEIIYLTNFNS